MGMVYDIHRIEGDHLVYHLFDSYIDCWDYRKSHQRNSQGFYQGQRVGPWSEIMYREWTEDNLSQLNVHDHRIKETKSMEPVTETVTKLKVGTVYTHTKFGYVIEHWVREDRKAIRLSSTTNLFKEEVKELSEFFAKLSDMMED